MFGAPVTDLFRSILGIRQAAGSAAYDEVIIAPAVIDDLRYASGHMTTVKGKIAVSYTRTDNVYELRIEIPADMRASLSLGGAVKALHAGTNICRISV